jgi:hypothetical protein
MITIPNTPSDIITLRVKISTYEFTGGDTNIQTTDPTYLHTPTEVHIHKTMHKVCTHIHKCTPAHMHMFHVYNTHVYISTHTWMCAHEYTCGTCPFILIFILY